MYYIKILITLLYLVYYCNGCLRNSAAQVGPTVTIGPMFTTTTTTICPAPCGAVPADATITVGPIDCTTGDTTLTCVNPLMMLRFNGVETLASPQSITCTGAGTPGGGNYEYMGITGAVVIVTVTCV